MSGIYLKRAFYETSTPLSELCSKSSPRLSVIEPRRKKREVRQTENESFLSLCGRNRRSGTINQNEAEHSPTHAGNNTFEADCQASRKDCLGKFSKKRHPSKQPELYAASRKSRRKKSLDSSIQKINKRLRKKFQKSSEDPTRISVSKLTSKCLEEKESMTSCDRNRKKKQFPAKDVKSSVKHARKRLSIDNEFVVNFIRKFHAGLDYHANRNTKFQKDVLQAEVAAKAVSCKNVLNGSTYRNSATQSLLKVIRTKQSLCTDLETTRNDVSHQTEGDPTSQNLHPYMEDVAEDEGNRSTTAFQKLSYPQTDAKELSNDELSDMPVDDTVRQDSSYHTEALQKNFSPPNDTFRSLATTRKTKQEVFRTRCKISNVAAADAHANVTHSKNTSFKRLIAVRKPKHGTKKMRNETERETTSECVVDETLSYPSTSTPFDSPDVQTRRVPSTVRNLSPIAEDSPKVEDPPNSLIEASLVFASRTYGKESSREDRLWMSFAHSTMSTSHTVQEETSVGSSLPQELLFESPALSSRDSKRNLKKAEDLLIKEGKRKSARPYNSEDGRKSSRSKAVNGRSKRDGLTCSQMIKDQTREEIWEQLSEHFEVISNSTLCIEKTKNRGYFF